MVHLISNKGGARTGFNAIVLAAALKDGQLEAAQHAAASKVAAVAQGLAAAHHRTGNLEQSIKIRRLNKADLAVTMTDPAARHIEFGHEAPDGSWVSGLHIMRNAALVSGGIVDFPAKGTADTGVPN